ncbi:hypothetical protein IFR05_004390 [Cadophora sp. M221]|nr:hypothetical protein IFR05_004390 [Cadophora sp. M221]
MRNYGFLGTDFVYFKGTQYHSESDGYSGFSSGILFLAPRSSIPLILYVSTMQLPMLLSHGSTNCGSQLFRQFYLKIDGTWMKQESWKALELMAWLLAMQIDVLFSGNSLVLGIEPRSLNRSTSRSKELHQETRYQLPKDNFEKYAKHYPKFNLLALFDVAVRAAGSGAKTCLELVKCTEDQYYKSFLMKMDNGEVVVAKLLRPNAGPAFYTIASEVATRQFLRTVFKLPVPRIHTFSSNVNNPIGYEYIIEEKARGEPLKQHWHQWCMRSKLGLVTQLVDFETKLNSLVFECHGCIYYQAHLIQKGFYASKKSASNLRNECYPPDDDDLQIPSCLEKFAVGPSIEARLWEGEKAGMNLDRGPWMSSLSYMKAMGTNEREWAVAHAKPQINDSRSPEPPTSPDEYISLLDKYLLLVPSLASPLFPNSLSHPDLRLDNIFVDPHTEEITCITGWQSACLSEPFFQYSLPDMLATLSMDNDLSTDSQTEDTQLYNSALNTNLITHYQNMSLLKNLRHFGTANLRGRSLLFDPTALVCGA